MIEVALLLVGAIIGAGFATGAEIVTFFDRFALPSWLIALLVGLALLVLISSIIFLYDKPTTPSHGLNYIFCLLYFVMLTAMTAGITQLLGVGVSLLAMIFSSIIVLTGFNQLTHINSLIVIMIVIALVIVCLPYVNFNAQVLKIQDVPTCTLSALCYAGLNCFIFNELIAATNKQSKRQLFGAGLITAILIAAFVFLILTAIRTTRTNQATMPIIAICGNTGMIVIILLAMLTSQYSSLFAITQRLKKTKLATIRPPILIFIISILSFICSFCGFNQIIQYAYPLIGAFICFFWLYAWVSWLISQRKLT